MRRRSLIHDAFRQVAGPPREVCPACFGPHPEGAELPPLVEVEGEPVPECPECGHPVFPDDRSAMRMGPDGRPTTVRVFVERNGAPQGVADGAKVTG